MYGKSQNVKKNEYNIWYLPPMIKRMIKRKIKKHVKTVDLSLSNNSYGIIALII